jgi:murein DD-endopeptidase MepM/ murein hydrolase activator NlpD
MSRFVSQEALAVMLLVGVAGAASAQFTNNPPRQPQPTWTRPAPPPARRPTPVLPPPRPVPNVTPRPANIARTGGGLTMNDNVPRSRPIANPLRVGNGTLNPARPSVGQGDGRFGAPRAGGRRHNGIDLNAPVGTPVYPVAPGRVIYSGDRGRRMGNEVKVYHPADRTTSVYMHLNGQQMPRNGTRVTPGNAIGQVGRTGNVPSRADSHLHLSVFDRNGKPLVPNIQSQPRVVP